MAKQKYSTKLIAKIRDWPDPLLVINSDTQEVIDDFPTSLDKLRKMHLLDPSAALLLEQGFAMIRLDDLLDHFTFMDNETIAEDFISLKQRYIRACFAWALGLADDWLGGQTDMLDLTDITENIFKSHHSDALNQLKQHRFPAGMLESGIFTPPSLVEKADGIILSYVGELPESNSFDADLLAFALSNSVIEPYASENFRVYDAAKVPVEIFAGSKAVFVPTEEKESSAKILFMVADAELSRGWAKAWAGPNRYSPQNLDSIIDKALNAAARAVNALM